MPSSLKPVNKLSAQEDAEMEAFVMKDGSANVLMDSTALTVKKSFAHHDAWMAGYVLLPVSASVHLDSMESIAIKQIAQPPALTEGPVSTLESVFALQD